MQASDLLASSLGALCAVVVTGSLVAAVAAQSAMPRPLQSPEVHPDGRITIRFRAPNATRVRLIGELDGRSYPMTRQEDGVWSVTVGPWPHNVYNYQFSIDGDENGQGGVIAMDPQNPSVKLGFGSFPPANMVEVPDASGLAFDDARPGVPHGTIRVETYDSRSLGVPRTLWVYTPPGYDGSTTRYPVFYLLHGSGNTDSSWMLTGRANIIMDNLVAEGRVRPMIIVTPLGYPRQGVGLGPEVGTAAWPPAGYGSPENLARFQRDLLEDVIPFVDKTFRTIPDPDDRALGGLSMGGGQTVAIGFSNLDAFHSLVVMSAGSPANVEQMHPAVFNDAAATNRKLKLLWIGVGKDDALVMSGARALDAALTARGITHTFKVTEGRHEWVVWRHHLQEVAPLLFR